MKAIFILFTLLLIISSCGLLKTTVKSTSTNELEKNVLATTSGIKDTRSLQTASRTRLVKDSLQLAYNMWFWPKGTLTFLPGGGFSGEFDSVLLKGNMNKLQQSSELLSTAAQNDEHLKTGSLYSQVENQKLETTEKKTEFRLLAIVIIVISLGLIGFLLFKR